LLVVRWLWGTLDFLLVAPSTTAKDKKEGNETDAGDYPHDYADYGAGR